MQNYSSSLNAILTPIVSCGYQLLSMSWLIRASRGTRAKLSQPRRGFEQAGARRLCSSGIVSAKRSWGRSHQPGFAHSGKSPFRCFPGKRTAEREVRLSPQGEQQATESGPIAGSWVRILRFCYEKFTPRGAKGFVVPPCEGVGLSLSIRIESRPTRLVMVVTDF